MMESPKMLKTLTGKNPDDGAQALNGCVGGKAETLSGGRGGAELGNAGCNVNSDGVSVEGKVECVGTGSMQNVVAVVSEEVNPARSVEHGNKCLDMGLTKFSEFGSRAGSQNVGGEVKENAVSFDSSEGLKDVPAQESDLGESVAKSKDALDIIVDKLVDEEHPPLVKEDVKVAGDVEISTIQGLATKNEISADITNCDDLKGDADQSVHYVKEKDVVYAEGSFSVGDLVWSMAKNNIWWPGVICDPLDAPKQAVKSRDPDKLLVRHFGSKNLVWSPPSHLKHFLDSFKEMSGQGRSKSFLGAIEKASEEVGRRVKLEMSCSCISKEVRARLVGRNKEDFKPWYVSNETAVVRFDPTSFIKRVKNLARMSYVPGVLETVATQSNAAAYYSYLGHSQMYLRHLREADVTAEDGVEEGIDLGIEQGIGQSPDTLMTKERPKLSSEDTAEKGFESRERKKSPKLSSEDMAEKGVESRERKKSKYLSFPFVDPSSNKALRDATASSEASGKRSASSSKRLHGKSVRKSPTATSPGDLKDIKVSTVQLFTELRDASRGCFYSNSNTILNSTSDFFCQFRRSAYRNDDSASNWYNDDGVFEKEGLEVQVASPLSEIKPAKKRRRSLTKKLEGLHNDAAVDQVTDVNLKLSSVTPVAKAQTKSRKRKASHVANHQTDKTDGFPDLNVNGDPPNNRIKKSSDKGKVPEANPRPKKRKNKQGAAASAHEPVNGLMDANVERHFGDSPAIPNANKVPGSAQNVDPENSDTLNDSEQMLLLPTDTKSPTKVETTSGLPDLNGNGLEPNSPSVKDPKLSYPAGSMIPASKPAAGGEGLPLSVIKNNLERMTKMMDQSGSNLSPEMRVKLETEVRNLLRKIQHMTGSSSS